MSPHVLFVDDDAHFLDGLHRMLRPYQQEWMMTFVPSAEAALQEMRTSLVDTVVADLRMPYQDGFTLLQSMMTSSTLCHIPIIIMTGAAERDLKRHALDHGATDLLSKPVDVEELIARIRNAIRLKTYQDQIHGQKDLLERKVRERTQALEASRIDLIWRLGRVAEFRDEQTGNHIMRVGSYCKAMAETLKMPSEFCDRIFLTSPLHDIGKIGIPDMILLKAQKFTADEWDVMKGHCVMGADILRQDAWRWFPPSAVAEVGSMADVEKNPFLAMASAIALSHHEWWDGTGYPQRLAGETIPLAARIVAVADVYDALGSARPYKPAFTEHAVMEIMQEKIGSHFDPAVYAAFLEALPAFRDIRRQLTDHAEAA
jgi:putative two-component system response regulator